MRGATVAILLAAASISGPAAGRAPPIPAPKDARAWAAAESLRPEQLRTLESIVNVDSGTGDVEGGRKVGALLVPRLKALGMDVRTVAAEAPDLPDNIVATLSGTGRGRILMIGHIDTVFGPGTVAQRPFRIAGGHATGPGVSDEKGGVVEGLYALRILHDLGFKDFGRITFLIETSEERGSPGTQALIKRLVGEADVELNLEPGDPPDVLTIWRKGSTTYHIDVKGRAAHAGVAPQAGRNAAVELIHQIQADDVFPHSGEGLTANLTLMKAGSRENIIPDTASAAINVRVRDKADFDRVRRTYEANAQHVQVPDTQVTVSSTPAFPPLANNVGTDGVAVRAEAIYEGIGRSIGLGGNGGASESALAYEAGVPALDGLGPVGGGFHSDQEYLDLNTLTPRLYLLAELLIDLGRNPPPRLR
ncbi:MAG TPA: glutamate carboxypeptidase [Allosphingosinicella sp.]|nr:glutamate carboxypeptidase [Allosphingosinicella sp.]